jgi:hypothetical protein
MNETYREPEIKRNQNYGVKEKNPFKTGIWDWSTAQ